MNNGEHPHDLIPVSNIKHENHPRSSNPLDALLSLGQYPQFTPPSKHAAGRVGKRRPKRRNRRHA